MTMGLNYFLISVVIVGTWFTPTQGTRILKASNIPRHLIHLDLSRQNWNAIDKDAFHNSSHVTSLNLADNRIRQLPESIFSSLTNLKNLSLSGNLLTSTTNVFAGLSNLDFLDISYNPLNRILDTNWFYGLTKRCTILMKGVDTFWAIRSAVFGLEESKYRPNVRNLGMIGGKSAVKSVKRRKATYNYSGYSFGQPDPLFESCMQNGTLQQLRDFSDRREMTSDCLIVNAKFGVVLLNARGISKFERRWYRLTKAQSDEACVSDMNLVSNNIFEATNDIVESLPLHIRMLNLSDNEIQRLQEKTFKHDGIEVLDLSHNRISEIAANALEMSKLNRLFLTSNEINDLGFVATLPSSISTLFLVGNKITEIPANSFSRLDGLRFLYLGENRINNVDPHAFLLPNIHILDLRSNEISDLDWNVFNGISGVQTLVLSNNKFTTIKANTFYLPMIRELEIANNSIAVIEKGAMRHMKYLMHFDIAYNPIKSLLNGAAFGMPKNGHSWIVLSSGQIEMIEGGLFDDV